MNLPISGTTGNLILMAATVVLLLPLWLWLRWGESCKRVMGATALVLDKFSGAYMWKETVFAKKPSMNIEIIDKSRLIV